MIERIAVARLAVNAGERDGKELLQNRLRPRFHFAERVGEGGDGLSRFKLDAGDAGLEIVGDARKVVVLRFPIPALNAVRVVMNVVVMGVGSELDKPAFCHLTALVPGEKTARPLVDARGDERNGGLCAIFPQQRESKGEVAHVAVVKGEQHCLLRQRCAVVELPRGKLARQDRYVSPVAQKIEVAPQSGDRDGVIRHLCGIVSEVVVFEHEKAPVGHGLCSAAFLWGRRRGDGRFRHGAAVKARRIRWRGLRRMRLTEKRHSQNDDEYAHRQLKKRHHAVGKKIDAAHSVTSLTPFISIRRKI